MKLARALAWGVVSLCLLVLAGWFLGVEGLTTLAPGLASMKLNTALCLILLSLPLALDLGRAWWVPPAVAFAVATATLAEYAADISLGLDQALVHDPGAGSNPPGRMAVATGVAMIVLALAEVADRRRRATLTLLLTVSTFVIAWIALLGYVYGVESLYAVVAYTSMAPQTAACLALLALGVSARSPEGALAWLLHGTGPGSLLMRRLVPLALLGIPLLGYLRLLGRRAGWFGLEFGLALVVTTSCIAVLGTAAWVARILDTADARRTEAELDLRWLNDSLAEGRDLAWSKVAELGDELAQEKIQFTRTLEQLDDAVWSVQVGADSELSPVYVSPNVRRVFGGDLPRGGTVLDALARLVHPDDIEAYSAFTGGLFEGRDAQTELRIIGLDAVTRWLWIRGHSRRDGDRLLFEGIATDVSERHELADRREALLEEERRQRRQLEEVEAMREEFIATAGHELRTPITAIRGYAELLLDEELTASQRRSVEVIFRRNLELQRLVADLFDLARLRSGQWHLAPATTRIDELLRQSAEALGPQLADAELSLDLDLPPTSACVDGPVVSQLVDNLLTNAMKYTPAGGTISLGCATEGDLVQISVSDNGIGIAPEELGHLFDRFFRANSALAHDIPGTGLGLAIVKRLVEAHGGTITVASAPGAGTGFVVSLPVGDLAATATPVVAASLGGPDRSGVA